MTAITYRKPAVRLDLLIGVTSGIPLRVSVDAVHGRQDRAPEGRKVRELVRALVAYKQGRKK